MSALTPIPHTDGVMEFVEQLDSCDTASITATLADTKVWQGQGGKAPKKESHSSHPGSCSIRMLHALPKRLGARC